MLRVTCSIRAIGISNRFASLYFFIDAKYFFILHRLFYEYITLDNHLVKSQFLICLILCSYKLMMLLASLITFLTLLTFIYNSIDVVDFFYNTLDVAHILDNHLDIVFQGHLIGLSKIGLNDSSIIRCKYLNEDYSVDDLSPP